MKKHPPELDALLAIDKREAVLGALVWALVVAAIVALGLLH